MPKRRTRLTATKEFTVFHSGGEACHYQQSPQVEGTMFNKRRQSTYTPVTSETFSTLAFSSFRVTLATVVTDTLLSAVWSKPPLWTLLCADCTLCRATRKKTQKKQRERNKLLYVHHRRNWNETPQLISVFLCK